MLVIIVLLLIFNEGAGAFFTQERPGYKGKIFKIIKFKTMNERRGADGNLLPDVQRITKFGRISLYRITNYPSSKILVHGSLVTTNTFD